MSANDLELLTQYIRDDSQEAFTTLVQRHLDLVYSAALRQVRSPQLAEEVAQTVFTKLACESARLKPATILSAWLYQVTRHTAIDVVRREARRQAREQIAYQMSEMNETPPDWTRIEPVLDEAMHSLDDADRTAILLRYFENKSLREVGLALGASEDAAQKRVSRAVEHLRDFLIKRKVAVGASGLAALVSANAIQAAPAGLATAIASGAVAASTAAAATATTAALTVTKTIAMTTLQKSLITVTVLGAVAFGAYEARQASQWHRQVTSLEQAQAQQSAWSNEVVELRRQIYQATNQLASLSGENVALKKNPSEVLKLRGEVGRLRQENASISSSSPISKVTANPESRKILRDQQKTGMGFIYRGLAQRVKLSTEQTEKLNDMLADHIMENVDNVTRVLRDKPDAAQMDQIFAAQEAVLQDKVRALLGDDGLAQYQDYTKNLLSTLSVEQFKSSLTGTDEEKEGKAKQLQQTLQEEVLAALSTAGLPADYQTMPILNFRNIASEQEAEKNLKLLESIYTQTAVRGSAYLSEAEVKKLDEFKATAIKNNRSVLSLNRTMMEPIAQ